ncbi:hypothetical protein J41TS12_43860 [Paenibacillus antibioticophila]|uniref:DUF4129 domain-containing protein n=1 Tax=Paenibacillus antibioticophila TaxID=1274374 RepID=A0A919XZ44_9BACL|nr:DUF4129 domain-containing protein [Paenibacillus antibioticophila]GIO39525.1 hypothetical protein J41TS12_43860 [Paenibacillus antibioticophila]
MNNFIRIRHGMSAWFRGWITALTENLFFLPVALLIYTYTVPEYYSWTAVWLLPAVSLLGAGGYVLGVRVRWKQALAALLLGLGYAGLVISSGGHPVLHAVIGSILAMQAMTAPSRDNRLKLYWIGITVYFIAGIAFPRFEKLSEYIPIVTVCGMLSLVILLLTTNRQFLNYSSLASSSGKSAIPKGVRRYNTVWIISIFVVALLLAAGAGRWAGNLLLGLLRRIVQWLLRPSDEPASEPEPPSSQGPPAEMVLPEETGPPGWLSQVLDILYNIVAGVLFLLVLALIGYGIYKYAGPMLSRLLRTLKKFFLRKGTEPARQEYEDEEVRLAIRGKTGKNRGQWAGKWTARFFKQGETWDKLRDNRDRIRYLYRRQRQLDEARGLSQQLSLTPKEQEQELRRQVLLTEGKGRRASAAHTNRDVMEPLLEAYYRVRYGDQQPGDEEVQLLKDKIQP